MNIVPRNGPIEVRLYFYIYLYMYCLFVFLILCFVFTSGEYSWSPLRDVGEGKCLCGVGVVFARRVYSKANLVPCVGNAFEPAIRFGGLRLFVAAFESTTRLGGLRPKCHLLVNAFEPTIRFGGVRLLFTSMCF